MASLRSLTKRWLPRDLKKHFQQLVLGYHSYAPSFSAAGEDMILRHIIGSDTMDGFYVDVGAYDLVRLSNVFFFYYNGIADSGESINGEGCNLAIPVDAFEGNGRLCF
jgi:hypothetical protein